MKFCSAPESTRPMQPGEVAYVVYANAFGYSLKIYTHTGDERCQRFWVERMLPTGKPDPCYEPHSWKPLDPVSLSDLGYKTISEANAAYRETLVSNIADAENHLKATRQCLASFDLYLQGAI